MNAFFYAIGDFFGYCFRIIERLKAAPNILFIIICFVAIALWLRRMKQYDNEAEQNGTLK